MNFEWDKKKAIENLKKHKIDFADAVFVFEDFNAITIDDFHPNEERFVTIGMDCFTRILVVVYAFRDDSIRLISARKADKSERNQYEFSV